jgi:D-galactose 1-dehydrogenase
MKSGPATDPKVKDPSGSIPLGLIGVGHIGQLQLDVLTEPGQTEFRVIAVADPVARTIDTRINTFRRYQDLLALEDVAAVAIATPPRDHYRMVLDALRAGKHVLVEKPPAITLAQCQDMISVAEESGRVLFMAYHARYNPAVEAARQELAGTEVLAVDINYGEWVFNYHNPDSWVVDPDVAGGGVLMDSGINAVSIVTAVLPRPLLYQIEKASLAYEDGIRVEVQATVDFTFGTSGRGRIHLDWMHRGPEKRQITFVSAADTYVLDIVQNQLVRNGDALLDARALRQVVDQHSEYRGVYHDFATLIARGKSSTSTTELAFVMDVYRKGRS